MSQQSNEEEVKCTAESGPGEAEQTGEYWQRAPDSAASPDGAGRLPVCRCADTRHHHIDCPALECFARLQSALAAAAQQELAAAKARIAELESLLATRKAQVLHWRARFANAVNWLNLADCTCHKNNAIKCARCCGLEDAARSA